MATYTDFDTFDIFRAQCLYDRADTIMSALATCLAIADFSEFHIDVIGDDDDIFRIDLEKRCTSLDAFPGEIHVGFWF